MTPRGQIYHNCLKVPSVNPSHKLMKKRLKCVVEQKVLPNRIDPTLNYLAIPSFLICIIILKITVKTMLDIKSEV